MIKSQINHPNLLCRSGVDNQNYKHGLWGSRFKSVWKNMKARCNNPKTNGYANYGGRGIKVCERWLTFSNFIEDMYDSYIKHSNIYGEVDTTLDRIDVNKNYIPENCKWSTKKEQSKNRRNSLPICPTCNQGIRNKLENEYE